MENEFLERLSVSLTLILISTLETSGKIKKLGETGPEHWLEYQVCALTQEGGETFKPFSYPFNHPISEMWGLCFLDVCSLKYWKSFHILLWMGRTVRYRLL